MRQLRNVLKQDMRDVVAEALEQDMRDVVAEALEQDTFKQDMRNVVAEALEQDTFKQDMRNVVAEALEQDPRLARIEKDVRGLVSHQPNIQIPKEKSLERHSLLI